MTHFASDRSARKPATTAAAGTARSQITSVSSRNAFPSDKSASLALYIPYIQSLLRKKASPGLEEEIKDVSQEVLLTLWLKVIPRQGEIASPKAYVYWVVHSHWVDAARQRQRRPTLPLLEEDGESSQDVVRFFPSEGIGDPALEYERKELIEEMIYEVTQLPPIQMKAMVCTLRDEIGNTFPLTEAFAKYGMDIRSIVWPVDSHERQSWLSSLCVARKKLRALKQRYTLA